MKQDTIAVHGGELKPNSEGAVVAPIFQSSTYDFTGQTNYKDLRYIRLSTTPNQLQVSKKLAELEGGADAVVTASGMAAISAALLSIVPKGGHLLIQEVLYGGTFHFVADVLESMGRTFSFFPLSDSSDLKKYIRPETKAIYIESVSNPLLNIPDFNSVVRIAKQHKLLTMVDNTLPSPVNFNPIALGFDVVAHSATKYLNGHSDIIAGCVVSRKDLIDQVKELLIVLGGALDPNSCYLLNRGLKTLGVRVRKQNETAMKLAEFLESQERISRVIYPGLSSHPECDRASELFRGPGGMLSFLYQGTAEETDTFLGRLKLPHVAPSLGGVETLVTRPVTTSHAAVPKKERERLGIAENLVRVSVGLEDADDLMDDFSVAL